MLLLPLLLTYTNPAVAAIPCCGVVPAGNGEPATAVSAPPLPIEYPETLLLPSLATYANLPEGSTATAPGAVPAGKGAHRRPPRRWWYSG